MAEPARKLEDETQPYERSIPDGKNTDSGQNNNLDELESNAGYSDDNPAPDEEGNNLRTAVGLWKNNVSNQKKAEEDKQSKTLRKGQAYLRLAKRKGPLTAIILTVIGSIIGVGGLLSPGLLIVNLKEVMVNKFNTQLTSMDVRTNKILKSKMLGSLSGSCGSLIKCKYSTLSDAQIANFKKAGIEVAFDPAESTSALGRKKVKGLTFEGETILPSGFGDKLNNSAKFRSAVKKGYNPLFAGFADSIWNKAILKLRISKTGIKLEGTTDEEKLKSIQADTRNPSPLIDNLKRPTMDDLDENSKPKYKNEADFNKALNEFNVANPDFDISKKLGSELATGAEEVAETGIKAASKTTAKKLLSVVSATGVVDNMCTIYGTTRAVGFAAKTVRAAQLARYAMIFLVMADQIKAGGNPDPADVSYLGSTLTKEVASTIKLTDGTEKTVYKSATDSDGYKYAGYNEVSPLPDSATQFLAGAGLTGSLIEVTSVINKTLGNTPNKTCRTINNVFFQIGSAAVGIGAAVLSGGVTITIGMAVSAGLGIATAVALAYLPTLLKDIVAGVVVDENTVGELAGNAITSGASGMMGTIAATGGNSPLTVEQAIAYQSMSNDVAAQYAEEDRITHSPLDISNKNTFLGSIFSKLTPYLSKTSSLTGSLSSITSLISNSFASLAPITKAADGSEYKICQDADYVNMNLAADPFCNLVYGIPTDVLQNLDPIEVVDKLLNLGQIDSDGNIIGQNFNDFTKECTQRSDPIGYTGDSFNKDPGDGCLIDNTTKYGGLNKYFYLYQIDQRVEQGMDGEDETLNLAMETGLNSDISFYDGSNGINSNIAKTSTTKTKVITNIQPANLSSILNLPGFNFADNKSYGL